MDPKEQLHRIREEMISALAEVMDWYNLTPAAGKLYGYMFFEDSPITLETAADIMGMSKSNMSYAVRSLIDAKMVFKLDHKAHRKELYQAEPDFLSSFQNFLASKLERERAVVVSTLNAVLPELESLLHDPTLDEDLRTEAHHLFVKVHHAKSYYTWLRGFIDRLKQETLSID